MTQNLNHYEKILSRSHSNYLAQISIEMTDANNQINDVLSCVRRERMPVRRGFFADSSQKAHCARYRADVSQADPCRRRAEPAAQ